MSTAPPPTPKQFLDFVNARLAEYEKIGHLEPAPVRSHYDPVTKRITAWIPGAYALGEEE